MSAKTILYLDHTAKLGGGEIALLDLVVALDKTRYTPVVVLASDGPLAERLKDAGIETHVMLLDPSIVDTRKDSLGAGSLLKLKQGRLFAGYARRIAKWARQRGVDLIHTNSLKSDFYGGLAGRLARIPVIWHVRDSINSEYLPAPVATAFRGLSRTIPTQVVANSESTLRYLGPRRRSGAVVYSGVTMRKEQSERSDDALHAEAPTSAKPQTVAIIGRIAEWKGQHIFLQAASTIRKQFPQCRFWIIGAPLFGEEAYEARIRGMVTDLELTDNVEFLGFRNDVGALLEQVDVVVHASILGEPFGQVVVQGMAAGKPVVATNGGALPEIVLPGITGALVPMGDSAAMAEAVIGMLADPEQARRMGAAGRKRVLEKFTIEHTAATIASVYDDVLRNSRRASMASGQAVSSAGRDS